MDHVTVEQTPVGTGRPLWRRWWDQLTDNHRALVAWTTASLVGNILIMVTGAFVRLTGSGLGCPTWPQCDDGSLVPHEGLGYHGIIEFANRTLTFLLVVLALGVFIAAVRSGADKFTVRWAFIAGLGIPLQAVIGGITVLTHLNPYVVGLHLMASLVLVMVLTVLLMHIRGVPRDVVPGPANLVAKLACAFMFVACWLGTLVTGSGPHSGGGPVSGVHRTGLDIAMIARVHSLSVWATVALSVLALLLLRRAGSSAVRFAWALLAAELVQGAIGYYQYFTGVPMVPVLFHLLFAGVAMSAATALAWSVRPQAKMSGSMAAATNTSAR
ncbi:COX15/CtaA family protein [Propionibacteriaceae bacterium Y1923]|uniref:COX15/CtaA family protein n=1 Tax=Aestuariimicrobium sp. Y1814 TaxID=3418742 RepID=UPI003C183685